MTVLPGENPLAYQGKEPVARDYINFRRDPTTRDFTNFNVGDSWINQLTNTIFRLTSKAAGIAIWTDISTGSGDVNQITADTGVAIPTAGNINLTGASQGISFRGSGDTLTVTNLRDLSAFTVEPLIGGSEFVTIQAAIDAAVAAGASSANPANVLVLPGTYTENITCADGVNIIGITGSGIPPFVNLNGFINCDQTGSIVIENIHVSAAGNAFQVTTGGGPFLAEIRKCFIESSAADAVSLLGNAVGFGRIDFIDCELRAAGITVDTQNNTVNFDRCFMRPAATNPAINLRGTTTVTVERSEVQNFVLLNQASSNFISRWTDYLSGLDETIQIANAGATATLTHNDITSNAVSGDWVNGAGTLQTGFNNTLKGTAVISSAGTIVVFPSG